MIKTLSVSAIKDGSVIDHIQAGNAFKIIELLKLTADAKRVTVGLNLKSRMLGMKDLIKVENFFLNQAQASQIAIFSPLATINVIQNYKTIKKFKVQMPEVISGILECPNPRCITNGGAIPTLFTVEENLKIQLFCRYCEKPRPM